jgi:hypothetical protein
LAGQFGVILRQTLIRQVKEYQMEQTPRLTQDRAKLTRQVKAYQTKYKPACCKQ